MKTIIVLGDGMADEPIEKLGEKTPLQYADTPNMDYLAANGVTGRLKTVADGFHPGSEVANMSVLGYDLPTVYEGRGVLEAASMGVQLAPDEIAMRCNLVCIEKDILKNHSAGHITTQEADELIKFLNKQLGTENIHFYTGVSYRNLLGHQRRQQTSEMYSSTRRTIATVPSVIDTTGSAGSGRNGKAVE